ncbi:MAG: UDP-N-acetylmuramoyl-tripeptide--D-alanyl-D-alanine ligase [Chloroflexota bacterium]|nr:UDP-N-acetylmuramoyl-tripeptide--D-alanyl-D-alanine ligase [Chloroflexota bacterium]MDE2894161.1 UDP-N-acetylmuramoyl-tripeptide--D-alanyl-D-alanine ligase [Chloroflexota bacterium]
MISSRDLEQLLGGLLLNEPETSAERFSEIVVDSREARPGALFVALQGEHQDGHQYVDDALFRGASYALVSEQSGLRGSSMVVVADPLFALQEAGRRWRRHSSAQIVGITGSVGKTTVREATFQLLSSRFSAHQSPRNFNGDIGLPIALLGISPSDQWAVIEIGPYSQEEMELLVSSAQSDIGIVTNVGPTHLERFGTLADTERIKGLLPESLPAHGLAVLNGDDPRVHRMSDRTTADVVTFGLGSHCRVRAENIVTHGFGGISFELHDTLIDERVRVRSPLIGGHQAMTALAASCVGLRAGMELEEVAEALATLTPGSRLARRSAENGATIIDDSYNAAPLSMKAALDLLAASQPRRIALLGDMFELGSEEQAAHREIGSYAAERCDWLIAVGERSRDLIDAARESGHPQACWVAEADQAMDILRHSLEPSDTLLIKASHAMHLETVVERLAAP